MSNIQAVMQLTDLTWAAVRSLDKSMPIVIPLAALEQHGHHLPLFTDSILLGEVVRRVAETMRDRVVFAPLMWLGNSDHHLDFPGTLSACPRTYLDLVSGLAENLLTHGFRRLVFLNGHGGNDVPGRQALFEVRQRHREQSDLLLLLATYWHLVDGPTPGNPELRQSEMGHACEWETSMMLAVAPHLVGELRALEPVPFGRPFTPASRAWITRDRTVIGHIGDPRSATAQKGEQLLTWFADGAVRLLQRVVDWDGRSWDG
jgi:creatinine amidohydrolase